MGAEGRRRTLGLRATQVRRLRLRDPAILGHRVQTVHARLLHEWRSCRPTLCIEKVQEFVRAFNKLRLSDKTIYMNAPSMWMVPTVMASLMQGQCVLVEPMISEIGVPFEKFNSNTGYAAEERDFIHALSHFSYHVSGGSYLLCELQGGRFKDRYILTDPVVLSANREFGAADLGAEGIQNFLHFHKCGRFCRSTWKTRHKTERHFMPQKRTAFMQLDS